MKIVKVGIYILFRFINQRHPSFPNMHGMMTMNYGHMYIYM